MTAGQLPPKTRLPDIDDEVLARLRVRVRGDLLCPGDPGYDAARTVWNPGSIAARR